MDKDGYTHTHTHTHTHTMDINHKKNEMLPFATTWMDLGGTTLSEVNQKERQILYALLYMWHIKNKTNK